MTSDQSIAVMMLYEEGRFDLNDDVGQWIDALKELASGPAARPRSPHRPGDRTGAGAPFAQSNEWTDLRLSLRPPDDEIYRIKGYDLRVRARCRPRPGRTRLVLESPGIPAGSGWNYSVSVDVLGRLIEIWSGQSFESFLQERVLGPLAMTDTDWYCPREMGPPGDALRAPRWRLLPVRRARQGRDARAAYSRRWWGLVSSASDYQRFMTMLLQGGELDGVRLLSSRTLE